MDAEWKKYNLGIYRENIQIVEKKDEIRWSQNTKSGQLTTKMDYDAIIVDIVVV